MYFWHQLPLSGLRNRQYYSFEIQYTVV